MDQSQHDGDFKQQRRKKDRNHTFEEKIHVMTLFWTVWEKYAGRLQQQAALNQDLHGD